MFTFVLGLGVFFLTLFSTSSGGGKGIQGARTLFGSIFGIGAGEARVAAAVALVAIGLTLVIARPLLFASSRPRWQPRGACPTRLLGIGFVGLLGVVAAEADPGGRGAAAAWSARRSGRRRAQAGRNPYAGIALAGGLAVVAMWGGLALGYAVPGLPPSTAIVAIAVGMYYVSTIVG